jgi:SAM-dependent methyltransferase
MADTNLSEADFSEFLRGLPADDYLGVHQTRFLETFRRARPFLESCRTIVELGPASPISRFLATTGRTVSTVESDLRFPYPPGLGQFDAVLSLEVLEHLNDAHRPESSIEEVAMFAGTGARRMFGESWRILKPGGILLITTPNACSVDAIANVLRWRHPFQYPPHVREYTPSDVQQMGLEVGFQLVQVSTFFAWGSPTDIDRNALIQALIELGFDMSNRGNDALYVLRK